jgi:hypothetical protein
MTLSTFDLRNQSILRLEYPKRRSFSSFLKFAFVVAGFALLLFAPAGRAQSSSANSPSASSNGATADSTTQHVEPGQTYVRPTEKEKLRNFAFDAFGPYPFAGAIFVAGIQQGYGTPPEWGQGWDAYGVRVASDYGIALTTTTARYALAKVFHEDTLYYPCECSGLRPRLFHALISTVTARRGEDGHRVFSFAAFSAPYAGTMTAALGWYPDRFGPKDGFRMGNYNLLGQAAQNLALEFVYGGPHSFLVKKNIHVPGLSGKVGGTASDSK